MNFLTRNNVRTTVTRLFPSLNSSSSNSRTQLFIKKAAAPFRDPPAPQSYPDHLLRLTLLYTDNNSSRIEIVNVIKKEEASPEEWMLTIGENGIESFSGRGVEETDISEFPTGSIVYLANTAEAIYNKASKDEVALIKRVPATAIDDFGQVINYMKVITKDSNGEDIVLYTYPV